MGKPVSNNFYYFIITDEGTTAYPSMFSYFVIQYGKY